MNGPKEYLQAIGKMPDERLYQMLAHEPDYVPSAVEAARAELRRRGLSTEQPVLVGEEVKSESLPRWEYRIETVRGLRRVKLCEEMGAQGWELASANYSWSRHAYELYFKRRRQNTIPRPP